MRRGADRIGKRSTGEEEEVGVWEKRWRRTSDGGKIPVERMRRRVDGRKGGVWMSRVYEGKGAAG